MHCYINQSTTSIPITVITSDGLASWLAKQAESYSRWVSVCRFDAKPAQTCLLATSDGGLERVLLGVSDANDFWSFGVLPKQLPCGIYHIDNSDESLDVEQLKRAQLGWGLGSYHFDRYISPQPCDARLVVDDSSTLDELDNLVGSIFLLRDLINTPAEDLTPTRLAHRVKELAKEHDEASVRIIKGGVLASDYPAIHAVGRAAACEPQLIDLNWSARQPCLKLVLIGKGITFDSGGLDLKSSAGMRLMKKDMGGAAHAIALARMIMTAELPVQLRLLVPAAENAIGAHSYRPGDVIRTRAGKTVEIENTDAEGRLVLCDALSAAMDQKPDMVIDFATLTGAVTVALGPELPALYCNEELTANVLLAESDKHCDPMWRMPLYQAYTSFFASDIANLRNASTVPMAGSITAALFLQQFVSKEVCWMHFDMLAYNNTAKPGRPVGGEAMAIRAVFELLKKKCLS